MRYIIIPLLIILDLMWLYYSIIIFIYGMKSGNTDIINGSTTICIALHLTALIGGLAYLTINYW